LNTTLDVVQVYFRLHYLVNPFSMT
jgi:hypothetical protein